MKIINDIKLNFYRGALYQLQALCEGSISKANIVSIVPSYIPLTYFHLI